MSDIKIQDSADDQLPGGQAPLTQPERTGASNVDTMSFCRGVEVAAGSQNNASPVKPGLVNGVSPSNRESASVSGMCVAGRAQESAKPVDRRTIEGSYPGDSRSKPGDTAAASLRSAADNGGVRQPVGQARFNSKLDNPPVASYPAPENGD